ELFDWSGQEREDSPARYHAWSWILYHWLWSQRSTQFASYQKRLADGEAPGDAWIAAFPEFDPARPATLEKLDEELVRYEHGRRYVFYKVSAQTTAPYVDTPLSSADVHVLLAHGRYDLGPAGQARQRADLDAAVREALKLGKRADRIFSEWYRDGSSQAHQRYLQLEARCANAARR